MSLAEAARTKRSTITRRLRGPARRNPAGIGKRPGPPPRCLRAATAVAWLLATFAQALAGELVTVRIGTMPVVLSAPHGGEQPLPNVPVRQRTDLPKFQIVRDERTAELTEKIAATLADELGHVPYLVILRVERKYVDVNRPADHAYECEAAKAVYDAYHAALRKHCDDIRAKWKHGLLIDVHGQTLEEAAIFRGTLNLETVAALRRRVAPDVYLHLDRALAKQGLRVLPPLTERETRFTGGHIIRTYGSQHPDGIDAIQWEFGSELRQKEVLEHTARSAGVALAEFVRAYYLK
uniref:N-formylglutamate amidohydrolase n=1 Tax=Schlesneria paludicola TaxID=360056 RepID=A0A7C4LMY5_9PLAN